MKRTIGLLVCIVLIAADAKDKKSADPIVGTWKVQSVKVGGMDIEQFKDGTFTFKDGKLAMKTMRGERTSEYKIDASKKPATIDLTAKGGQRDGQVTKGIYEVKGDDLKICIGFMPDTERPKMFTDGEADLALITLKRDAGAKPDAKKEKP
jgi:uncharacterized protein (TIGR03067 family)